MDLVLKLRELRDLRGLSQKDVARLSGVGEKTISSFETGERIGATDAELQEALQRSAPPLERPPSYSDISPGFVDDEEEVGGRDLVQREPRGARLDDDPLAVGIGDRDGAPAWSSRTGSRSRSTWRWATRAAARAVAKRRGCA